MANGRHSYVAFYPSDWRAGTYYLSRMHKAAFFDICCYTWDTAQPCPPAVLASMLNDIKGWRDIVQDLVDMGKLTRNDDGSVVNAKAEAEAEKAFRAWKAMSDAGKGAGRGRPKGADRGADRGAIGEDASHPDREPEPEPELKDKPSTDARGALPRQPVGIDGGVWRDFKRQRKKPLTETALKGIQREADKAGWSLEQALRTATERGWQGFKAEWVDGGYRNGTGAGRATGNGFGRALEKAASIFDADDDGRVQ